MTPPSRCCATRGPQFVIPAPSREVRALIEARRAATIAAPRHASEADDAPPNILRALWLEMQGMAQHLGIADAPSSDAYDPQVYAAVYRHLLRHRHASVMPIDVALEAPESVYAHLAGLPQVKPPTPSPDSAGGEGH